MFRRVLVFLISVMLCLTSSLGVCAADSVVLDFGDVAGKSGDVDVDTFLTSSDLVTLKKILLGTLVPQSEKTANVNGTDGVDIRDLVRLKKVIIEFFGDFIEYRTPLTHTYKRLTEDKQLKVLYFGGSVTSGYGAKKDSWRSLSGEWFKTNFPEAEITTINTAIGESGTFLGTYRLQDDVIAKNPDLIFIEYAINDYYKGSSKEVAGLQYETIVREVRTALPKCDIVTLLVTDDSVVDLPTLYGTAAGHKEMAEYYGISTVNVGQYLWNVIGKTKKNWNDYFIDIVHPTDLGYKLYYQCLEEYLTNALLKFDFNGLTDKDKTVSEEIKSEYLLDGNRVAAMGTGLSTFVDSDKTVGFSFVSGKYFAGSDGALHVGYYEAPKTITDAQITFSFSGTEFALWTNLKKGSTITYSIDGGNWVTMECHEHAPTQVITGIESGNHTITVKPVTYKSGVESMMVHAIFTRDETLQTVKSGS